MRPRISTGISRSPSRNSVTFKPVKDAERRLADLLVAHAQRIGAVLINFDLNVRHAQAEVVEHMITACRAERGLGLVRQAPEFVQVLAADADLDGFIDRRALLELLDHATRRREQTYPILDATGRATV